MLSISEFSEMCSLPPQTLRFYHSEGLLVPAEVDERTGYRSYRFDQVERAMLVTSLRGTGMSVKLVRRALDEPDTALALLERHTAEVLRRRRAQDDAIRDAREFLTSRPEPRLRHVPAMTVASKPVSGTHGAPDRYDWEEADAAATATAQDLVTALESRGAVVQGAPWRTWATETPEQKRGALTGEGPLWLVKVPITADEKTMAALPGGVEVQSFPARDELSIVIPGRSSMAKFGTAMARLTTHILDNAYIDISQLRYVLHDDRVEIAMAIRELDETDPVG